jgi:hypothetical protein
MQDLGHLSMLKRELTLSGLQAQFRFLKICASRESRQQKIFRPIAAKETLSVTAGGEVPGKALMTWSVWVNASCRLSIAFPMRMVTTQILVCARGPVSHGIGLFGYFGKRFDISK